MRELMPHQREALEFCKKRNHVALFLEMRLGKTLVLIRWAKEIIPRGPILVVAPKTVLTSWCEELQKENELYHLVQESPAEARWRNILPLIEGVNNSRVWFLMSYGTLRHTEEAVGPGIDWQLVALDESTYVKNPQTKTSELVCKGFRHVPHRAVLSGMPWPENTLELYQQLKFLWGGFRGCTSYWEFRSKYYNPPFRAWGDWVLKREEWDRMKELIHQRCFIRTRNQVDMGKKKVHEKRVVSMDFKTIDLYSQIERDWAYEGEKTKWSMVVHTWLSRLAGGFDPKGRLLSDHKLKELMSLLTGEFQGESVVVWARFLAEIDAVSDRLSEAGVKHEVLTGESGSSVEDRSALLDRFNSQQSRVLVCQEALARYGINVSQADTAIYYSNYYSFEVRTQSEDRIIHPMKNSPLLYLDLVSENTIDEDVVEVLQAKKIHAKSFMRLLKDAMAERIEKHE